MPITIDVAKEKQIVHVVGTGVITVPLCAEAMANLTNHPDFESQFGVVVDFRQATNTPSMTQMRELATLFYGYKDSIDGRIGLVVKNTDAKKAAVMCMLVRVFGVKMESYGEVDKAIKYVTTGTSGLKF